jgi:hypothetical protein
MLLLLGVLTDHGVDHCFEDILFRHNTLHILDEVISIVDLIIFKIVYHKVQSSLRDHIHKRWQNLEGVFSSSEDH